MSNKQMSFNEIFEPKKSVNNKKSRKKSIDKEAKGYVQKYKKNDLVSSKPNNVQKTRKTLSKTAIIKESKTKRKPKTNKVTFTQDELDKLCEIYDWYIRVKDLDNLRDDLSHNSSKVLVEKQIIKNPKKISITVDKEIWDNFSALATNIGEKKGNLLSDVLKTYLINHKDLY